MSIERAAQRAMPQRPGPRTCPAHVRRVARNAEHEVQLVQLRIAAFVADVGLE